MKATANERSQAGAWERCEGDRRRAFPKLELGNEVKATANERSQAGAWERGEGEPQASVPKLELGNEMNPQTEP